MFLAVVVAFRVFTATAKACNLCPARLVDMMLQLMSWHNSIVAFIALNWLMAAYFFVVRDIFNVKNNTTTVFAI